MSDCGETCIHYEVCGSMKPQIECYYYEQKRPHGEWIEDIRSMICEVNDYYGYTDSMHMFKVLFDQKYHGWKKEGDEK